MLHENRANGNAYLLEIRTHDTFYQLSNGSTMYTMLRHPRGTPCAPIDLKLCHFDFSIREQKQLEYFTKKSRMCIKNDVFLKLEKFANKTTLDRE